MDQFYGIEIDEFPAKIARTALYLIDHLANREVSAEFGQHLVRFPIPAAPHIEQANALRIDWNGVVPASACDFVFGNPPFGGHVTRSRSQTEDLQDVWGDGYAKWLDHVTGWYRKALDYGQGHSTRFAFVSTNSISQGEQVARLWRPLFGAGYTIRFAHQTFAWTSEARGTAHVHVVIVGFSHGPLTAQRRLFTYARPQADAIEVAARNISPYLVEGPDVTVAGRSTPLSASMPPIHYGSLPSDGGALIVTADEYPHGDPVAQKYLRRYVGSNELLNGIQRWCLWMPDGPAPRDAQRSSFIRGRLLAVTESRLASRNPDTRDLADQPYRFFHNAQPTTAYLGIPAQVSQTRRWYTVELLGPDVIASNALYTGEDPDGFLFGLLSSAMLITWLRGIGGALKSDLRYSKSIVHNTFPLPAGFPAAKRHAVISAGRAVRQVRKRYTGATLAELYDPLATPAELIAAHDRLDKAVDALFDDRRRKWAELARLSHLIERYATAIETT